MRRSSRDEGEDNSGYDSFLDIIANLVGILIILVVVIGAQVSSQWSQTQVEEPGEYAKELANLKVALQEANYKANKVELDNAELGRRARQEEAMSTLAESERDRLQKMVLLAEREVEAKIKSANLDQKNTAELEGRLAGYTQEAQDIQAELKFLESNDEPQNQLQHHATPIAQAVFNDEIHFRLKSGHLAYVPLDELVNEMTAQLRFSVEKLRTAAETVEIAGPIGPFRMQYALRLKEQLMQTELGVIRREQPEFVGFILLPAREILGDRAEEALRNPQSEFQSKLKSLPPEKTTVTILVYPDSYDEYLLLESWLHERKFLVASWPLPENQPISGGPNGYHSAAQ